MVVEEDGVGDVGARAQHPEVGEKAERRLAVAAHHLVDGDRL